MSTGGPTDQEPAPLAGVEVVELGNLIAGPYCSMLLADMGADVTKIEPPSGDLGRVFGPHVGEASYYFAASNRGKKSVAIDPRAEETNPLVRKLCLEADVVVHNLRHGAMERMGLGYDDLVAENPGLVYAEVSAFGSTGPDADRAGIDILFQGESGMMSISGEDSGPPTKTATTVGDYLAGTNAAVAVCAALVGRATTGRGRKVDISLRDSLIAVQSTWNAMFFATGDQPGRVGTASLFTAPTQTFATADGYINLAIVSDRHFAMLSEELDLDVADDPAFATNSARVENMQTLGELVSAVFATAGTDTWLERLLARGLPVGRVLDFAEVFDDPQVRHNQMQVELEHPTLGPLPVTGSPIHVDGRQAIAAEAPPILGEHTLQVLTELGATSAQIEELRLAGLVTIP
jgi:crotonobetainyl-CoA:carnitine CoA-transferase CaiB-like acyl-CoA transferase